MADEDYMALADRVYTFIQDKTMFTFADVKENFPTEADKSLYRAIDRLRATNRVRFVSYKGRRKVFTAIGQTQLPQFRNSEGDYIPISMIVSQPDGFYPGELMGGMEEVNQLGIVLGRFFIIAHMDDLVEQRRAYITNHRELTLIRSRLENYLGIVDAVLSHNSMSGDLKVFNRIFKNYDDEYVPKPDVITQFKLWLSRRMQGLKMT